MTSSIDHRDFTEIRKRENLNVVQRNSHLLVAGGSRDIQMKVLASRDTAGRTDDVIKYDLPTLGIQTQITGPIGEVEDSPKARDGVQAEVHIDRIVVGRY